MKIYVLLLIVSLGKVALSQNLASDLRNVEKSHAEEKVKVFDVQYRGFEDHYSSKVLEQEKALYIRKGKYRFYMENSAVISVYDKGKTVLIDREEKKLMYLYQEKLLTRPGDLPIDSLLQLCSSVKFIGEKDAERTYQLVFDMEFFEYQKVQVSINTQTWDVKSMILFYNTPLPIYEGNQVVDYTLPRLEIGYEPVAPAPNHTRLLEIENYLTVKGNGHTLTPAYRNYELIDHSQTP